MIEVRAGDLFLINNPTLFGRAINFVQQLTCKEDRAIYDHAGVIVDVTGTTLESRWTICQNNFFQYYKGRQVLVARYTKLTKDELNAGLDEFFSHKGDWYPAWRLITSLLFLSKVIHWNNGVCSERIAKLLHIFGARDYHWFGVTPEDLEDEFKHWKDYEIVFEGIL